MRSRLRLAVGSGLESGVELCPFGKSRDAGLAFGNCPRGKNGNEAMHINGCAADAPHLNPASNATLDQRPSPVSEWVTAAFEKDGAVMPDAIPGTASSRVAALYFDDRAHLRVLSNANGGVETDAVEDFDGCFAGLDGAETPWIESRFNPAMSAGNGLGAHQMAVVYLIQKDDDALTSVGRIIPHLTDCVDAPVDRIDAPRRGGLHRVDTILRRYTHDLVANFPVEVAHSVTIEEFVPEIAWEDDDLGLRLGVEGDAGEWEWEWVMPPPLRGAIGG